ncbi:transglycosylase SLT domain-containing protein [Streptomyces sp. 549]|uniref:aggregation-promoting factor C-terminal-like domain-containing protein n=1 Tax=Streptomyces sp. 549 TaxID=3049076 RepID=UPI0024C23DE4|nr:transglycosylase SLT domain-containing protein [Streptomyces sp. 549]MDK1476603.1 transglycosylase SLT domain-containing protein [Streptomyces sp. 549]
MTTRISVRGFAVASATAVTTVGAVVGVATGSQAGTTEPVELASADATLLADIPMDGNIQIQTASLTQQADVQSDAAHAAAKKTAEEGARKQAAKDAAAKKQAAEEKAAKERAEKAAKEREEKAAASRSAERTATASAPSSTSFAPQSSYTVAEVKAMAQQIVGGGQFQCFSNIVQRESTWNYKAENPSSGAYGLVQALPASKMASAGADWRTNPATQIKWGVNYMNERYGSPCGAWEFWQANHWY